MNVDFSKFRWPYREDNLFSVLAFLVLVVPLAFSFKTYENYEMIKFVLWLVLLGCAVIIFFINLAKAGLENGKFNSERKISKSWEIRGDKWFFILSGNFIFWALLSTIFSVDLLNSIFGFYYRFTSGLLFYVSWLAFLILLLKTLNRDRLVFLAKILVFDSLVIGVLGFFQSIGIGYYQGLTDPGFVRSPSLLGNPDFSAMFLVGVLPLAVALAFSGKSFSSKIYYAIAAFFIVLANMVLSSRASLLGIFVSFAIAVFFLVRYRFKIKHLKWIILGAVLVLSLGVALMEISRPQAFSSAINFSESNVALRFTVWKSSLYGLVHHPMLGVGPGNFHIFFEQYRQRFLDSSVMIFDDAHNLFFQIGVTSGLPVLLSFIGLIVMSAMASIKQVKQDRDPLILACLIGMIALLIAACFNPVTIPNLMLLAVFIAGGLILTVKDYQFSAPKAVKFIGILAGTLITIFGISLLVGEYLYFFGYQEYFRGNFSNASKLTRAALAINPTNQMYYIYNTASEIKLNKPQELIAGQIGRTERLHPAQARSFIISANLYSVLYWQTGDLKFIQQAIDRLHAFLELDKHTATAYQQLGLYAFQMGNLDQAEKYLMDSVEMKNDHFPSWMLLAKIYQLENKKSQTLFALEKAYKLRSDSQQIRALWLIAKNEPDINKVPIQITIGEGALE